MGVNSLWKWFSSNGMLEECRGDEANAKVVSSLQDAVLAVDLSGWILQASKQQTLMEMYNLQMCKCLPVLIGRVGPQRKPFQKQLCTETLSLKSVMYKLQLSQCLGG